MKRTCIFLATALLVGAGASALASARDASPAAPAATPAASAALFHTVELRKTKLGKVLVNSAGSILYEFTRDKPKQSACAKVSGCPEVWPAFPAQGKPSAGPGVHASLLSTIKVSVRPRSPTPATRSTSTGPRPHRPNTSGRSSSVAPGMRSTPRGSR